MPFAPIMKHLFLQTFFDDHHDSVYYHEFVGLSNNQMHLNAVNIVSLQLKWICTSAFWSTHSNVPTKASIKFVIKAAALQIRPCKCWSFWIFGFAFEWRRFVKLRFFFNRKNIPNINTILITLNNTNHSSDQHLVSISIDSIVNCSHQTEHLSQNQSQ